MLLGPTSSHRGAWPRQKLVDRGPPGRYRALLQCQAAGGSSSGNSSPGGGGSSSSGGGGSSGSRRGSRSERRARQPGMFEIKVMVPPPRSLGVYALPPTTHNGDTFDVDGQLYVVTALQLQYRLVKGRYVRSHNQLEVQPSGRYFLNMMLDRLVAARYMGPTGSQD